jgi:predicted flavoprotein YhiN
VQEFDVVVIGAGAAGLMCALTAGARGRRVLVLDHANRVGKKILMSGGGRCNFTNMYSTPDNFLSANPHFAKSALSRYTPWHFVEMVDRHRIAWHEKTLGQLFCDVSAKLIVKMLSDECDAVGVDVRTHTPVESIEVGSPHRLRIAAGEVRAGSLVIATGGYSIPSMGATGFGFDFARSLGLEVVPTRRRWCPSPSAAGRSSSWRGCPASRWIRWRPAATASSAKPCCSPTAASAVPRCCRCRPTGIPGDSVEFDLWPGAEIAQAIAQARLERPKIALRTLLAERWSKRLAQRWCELWLPDQPIDQLSRVEIDRIAAATHRWRVKPSGTEGYRTAEVTIGGVDTRHLSSKTMALRDQPNLYFIGEVVDVTGHLGGHNFQWAWASGHAAGEVA